MRCRFSASIAALAAVAACSSTQTSMTAPTADKCQVSASSSPSAFAAGGGQGSLNITTARDCTWSITTEAAWVSIPGEKGGQGEAAVAYSVAPNPAPAARSAMVMIGSQGVTVNQAAAPCLFTLSRPGDAIGSAGGRLSLDVATLTGCSWSAASDASWITITSGQNGAASAAVVLAIASNGGTARVGHVNIGGQIYTVNQDAAPVTAQPQPGPKPPPPPAPPPVPPPPPPPGPGGTAVAFDGDIAGLSGKCPNVTFSISAAAVIADKTTKFKDSSCGDLRNGRSVSGQGTTQADGSIKATQIQVDKHDR